MGVGGVFTMTGVFLSPGGVSGRRVVSIFWPREKRRVRSEEVTLAAPVSGFGGSSASGLGRLVADAEDAEARSRSAKGALRSGLELALLVDSLLLPELVFGLNAALSRPTGDGDLLAEVEGGPRPVLLVTRGVADSRPSTVGLGKLDEDRGDGSDGGRCDGCDSSW